MQAKIILALVIALAMSSLGGAVYYYKSLAAANEVKFTQEKADKEKALTANDSLKKQHEENIASTESYIKEIESLNEQHAEVSRDLQRSQAKNARRDWAGIRSSRGGERALKIINKSIPKKHKEWAGE